jgi:tRNA(Ile)-lysidine synthase
MVLPGETVLVGVSGGLDSVSLLDLLARLRKEFGLSLVVAHVHHGLRPEEGEKEFRFVEDLALGHGFAFEGLRVESACYSEGGNVQARARALRLRFFEEVSQRWGAARIATGHHRDDHTETLLMQVLRGTGGLMGIRPVREGRYIRPLIETSRETIQAYAREAGLRFCEDSSNHRKTYLRNRIRQELIPWIQREVNPSFVDSLLQLSSILQEEAACLDATAQEAFEAAASRVAPDSELILRRDLLCRMPRALQRRVLRLSFGRIAGSTQGLSYDHTEGICNALARQDGRVHKEFVLPGGVRVFLEYETVQFARRALWEAAPYEIPFEPGSGGPIPIPGAGILLLAQRCSPDAASPSMPEDPNCALMDAERARGAMVVRNARPGDRFRPLGLGGEKKLKDFFLDRRIPRSVRRRIAILEIDGQVAWVVGHRMDDRFKVTGRTREVLMLRSLPGVPETEPLPGRIRQTR